MTNPKTVQIDYELFKNLVDYARRHYDPEDPQFELIQCGVQKKLDSMFRHDMYSLYKSGASEQERSAARAKYLDEIGLFDDFKWLNSQDANVTRQPF